MDTPTDSRRHSMSARSTRVAAAIASALVSILVATGAAAMHPEPGNPTAAAVMEGPMQSGDRRLPLAPPVVAPETTGAAVVSAGYRRYHPAPRGRRYGPAYRHRGHGYYPGPWRPWRAGPRRGPVVVLPAPIYVYPPVVPLPRRGPVVIFAPR